MDESRYIFNGFEPGDNTKIDDSISILPEGKYLTLPYSKDEEEESKNKMLHYIKKNNLKIR